MNRAPHDSGDDDSRRRAVKLNMAAARLDVFRHERLGYTEIPVMSSPPRPTRRITALMKAICGWFISGS